MEVRFFNATVASFAFTDDIKVRAKIFRMIHRLETFGYELRMPDSRALGDNLFELRARGASHIRLLYTFKNSHAIILHGFVKKSQKIPARELTIALRRKRVLA